MSLHIFSPVWGDHCLNLLDKALGESLRWKENNKAIQGAKWTIVCDDDGHRQKAIIETILPGCNVTVLSEPQLLDPHIDYGQISMAGVIKTAATCIEEKSQFLMATPDFVFGEGTIASLREIGKRKDSCVGMAHIRVTPEFLREVGPKPMSNSQLMAAAFRNPHDTWTLSEVGLDPSMSYHGGISWRRLNDSTYAVTHRLVSTFLVNFKSWDLKYFSEPNGAKPTSFGKWDHAWNEHLLEQQRLRLVGSSDGAAMAEVTEVSKNMSPMHPANPADPDLFYLDRHHTRIQKQFVSIFRGE